MTSSPALRMSVWVVPIVVVVCALVLLPAGSIAGAVGGATTPSAGAHNSGASASALSATSSAIGKNPVTPFSAPTTGETTSTFSPLNGATTSTAYSTDLSKLALHTDLGSGNALTALAGDIASGKVSPRSVYLPNLNLLQSGPRSPGQSVGSGYVANPAPMGIGDIGVGASPYVYNTTHFAGSLNLNAANATYPGAYYFIGTADGGYTSPYNFGIQLNTVTNNVSTPGNNRTALWTQNVVTLNGNTIQFENNVWNFSNTELFLNPGTIVSGNGTYVAPSYYYDYGKPMPLTFPVTVDIYNNISVVPSGKFAMDDQVTFGYRVVDSAGTFTGIYDTVIFNNTDPAKSLSPGFQVSGKYTTPLGLDYDAELIFGGPGGGSNAVFNNISGTETLQYANNTGGWKTVPSAYDFGSDTGETAIGVAETYSPAGVVTLTPGASLLYGMWHTAAPVQAASGSIEVQGTITPNWGFVVIGDASGNWYNASVVPTTITGQFETLLPPTTGTLPAGNAYYLWGLADGYARDQVGPITASSTGLVLTMTASAGQWTEPLYLDGNAQAQSAATTLEGWTTGPYKFTGLTLLNGYDAGFADAQFFDRLNDWGFVSFNLVQITGVTNPVVVTDVVQGDSLPGIPANEYSLDGPAIHSPTTILGLAPEFTSDLPDYGGLIALYSDSNARVTDQTVVGYYSGSNLSPSGYYNLEPAGGAVVFWNDAIANVSGLTSTDGSFGAWVVGGSGFTAWDVAGYYGANGVSLIGSSDAVVHGAYGEYSILWADHEGSSAEIPFGVYDANSTGGTFTDVVGFFGGVGFADYFGHDAVVNGAYSIFPTLNITDEPYYVEYYSFAVALNGAVGTHINDTISYYLSAGVGDGIYGYGSLGTTITNLSCTDAYDYGYGFILFGSDWTNMTNVALNNTYYGGALEFTQNVSFVNTWISDDYIGIEGFIDDNTTFTNTYVNDIFSYNDEPGYGIFLEDVYDTTLNTFNASYEIEGVGAYLWYAYHTTLTDIIGYGALAVLVQYGSVVTATDITGTYYLFDWAVMLEDGSDATVTGAVGTLDSGAVSFEDWNGATVSGVTATYGGVGVIIDPSNGVSVTGITATDDSEGLGVESGTNIAVSDGTATDDSEVAYFYDCFACSATKLTATDFSEALYVEESNNVQITDLTVSDVSIGVEAWDSQFVTISGVTATNTTTEYPWEHADYFDAPISAIVTGDDAGLAISDVTATDYPLALFDEESNGPTVTNLNATGGWYAVILNDTYSGLFTNIGAFQDYQGMLLQDDAGDNTITLSSFVDDTSYGVAITYGYDNTVYNNMFIGDNGATTTYSPSHIQAFAGDYNEFDLCTNYYCSTGVGNYWADWHTYGSNGYLAPYLVGGESYDYFPIGPQETFMVSFTETGLASGSWSVTLNGVTQSSTAATITFSETIGTYAFQIPSVTGYTVTPSSGTVTVGAANYNVSVAFAQVTYAVTLSAGGLSSGTVWSASVNGVTQSTTGPSLVWYLPSGKYDYSFNAVSGYNTPTNATGSVTVATAPANLGASYSPVSTPSYVQTSDFNNWLAIAIAVAVIALVIGLLALFLRRGKGGSQQQQGAQAWTPPPAASGGSGSSSWSEGPPSGGSPPPSS